jgi:hypothetical protein
MNGGTFKGYATGGWAGLNGPELAWVGEREPELVTPLSKLQATGAVLGGGESGALDHDALAKAIARELAAVLPDGSTVVQINGAGTEEVTSNVLGALNRRDIHNRQRRRRQQV